MLYGIFPVWDYLPFSNQMYILIKHCQAFLNRKKNFHSSCLIWLNFINSVYLLASQSWINIGIFTSFVFCLILSSHMMICSVQHTSMAALLLVLNSTSYKGWHQTHRAKHVWYSCRSMQNADYSPHSLTYNELQHLLYPCFVSWCSFISVTNKMPEYPLPQSRSWTVLLLGELLKEALKTWPKQKLKSWTDMVRSSPREISRRQKRDSTVWLKYVCLGLCFHFRGHEIV